MRRWVLLLAPALLACVDGRVPEQPPFTIDADADPAASAVVREALDLTQRYFRRVHGVELPRPVAVRLAGKTSCPGSRSTGGATADTLCIWTGGPGWARLMQRRSDALSLVAHEHVHNFQGQLGCLPAAPREYRWFTEGMAVHLSWRALIDGGAATEADYAAWFDRLAAQPGRVRPIADYAANVADGDRAYARVTRAVRELADRSGGDGALVRFCRTASTDWRAAFRATFGEDPAAFIARFDAANPLPADAR